MALLFCLCKKGTDCACTYAEWRECVIFSFIIVVEVVPRYLSLSGKVLNIYIRAFSFYKARCESGETKKLTYMSVVLKNVFIFEYR